MIEQEKAVQFRFESGTKDLSEKFAEIGLPPYVRLYSNTGLPNIFGWTNAENSELFQESWLYLPDEILTNILNSRIAIDRIEDNKTYSAGAFLIDNQILFPIRSHGKINCILAVPVSKQFSVAPGDLEKLGQIEKSVGRDEKSEVVQIAYEFISRLFDCQQSYSEFAQRLLNFLTDQVERSYAGLYCQDGESYHRRWSYGGLQFSDRLPVSVHSERVEMWKAANSSGRSFIPAELVQDEPIFAQTPPSFLFVHRAPDFGDREQWLVMVLPGDISEATIAKIKIIAGLLDALGGERLTGYADLVTMFSELLGKNCKVLQLDDALRACFKLLDGKLHVRSMRLMDTDNSVIACTKLGEDQLNIETAILYKIAEPGLKVLECRIPIYVNGPAQFPQTAKEADWDEPVSHMYFPVPVKESGATLLIVEISGGLERARHYQHLINLASKYLGICISLIKSESGEPKIVGTPTDEIAETMSLARLQTLSKLNSGYFHELVENLSVILGQAEILEYSLQRTKRPLSAEDLLQSTNRIVRAAESLVRRLEELKEVSTVKLLESGKSIKAEQFVNMLPVLTFGYYLTVKDNKNVEVEVQTKADKNVSFSIPVLHIYDFILPLILAIMDEAVCSGKIFVSVAEHFGRPVIRISYPKKLSGKLSLEKLADKVFKFYESKKSEKGELLIAANLAQFTFSACEGERYQAIYSNTSHHHPVQEYT